MELTADSVEYQANDGGPIMAPHGRQSPPSPAARRARPRRAGPAYAGRLRSELTKIGSVRSTYWTLLAQAVARIAWAVLLCAATVSHWPTESAGSRANSTRRQRAWGAVGCSAS